MQPVPAGQPLGRFWERCGAKTPSPLVKASTIFGARNFLSCSHLKSSNSRVILVSASAISFFRSASKHGRFKNVNCAWKFCRRVRKLNTLSPTSHRLAGTPKIIRTVSGGLDFARLGACSTLTSDRHILVCFGVNRHRHIATRSKSQRIEECSQ